MDPNTHTVPKHEHQAVQRSMSDDTTTSCVKAAPGSQGHMLVPHDPDNPMSWPLWKKVYTSLCASFFAFVIVYGTTTITAADAAIPKAYGVSPRLAHLAFTMPFFGVATAPLHTPHLSERYGRKPVYFTAVPLFCLCVVVLGLTNDFSTILAFRFLAGLLGGPTLVLIEGTFADLWSAQKTVTYYAFLAAPSYFGAAFGQIIGGYTLAAKGPAWLAWVILLFGTSALAFASAMPETYGRQILRTRIHYAKSGIVLPCALSGVTFKDMAHITFFTPLKMLVTEPLVILISLCVGLNFGLVFQWFISVPAALGGVYNFSIQQIGLAFFSAVGGMVLAVISCVLIEAASYKQAKALPLPIEKRLIPAIVGSLICTGALFWVAFTVNPKVGHVAPVAGTGFYVWGNAMILISLVSYLFDAYPPAGTLSALTAAACFRIICAGILPIFILDIIGSLGVEWTFSMFAILTFVVGLGPVVLFKFGAAWRTHSKYGHGKTTVQIEQDMDEMVHHRPAADAEAGMAAGS